jgi:hypothetical protein
MATATTNYSNNGFLVTGASATQGPFNLLGGKYVATVHRENHP